MMVQNHDLTDKGLLWPPTVQIHGSPGKTWLYWGRVLCEIDQRGMHRLLTDLRAILENETPVRDILDKLYDYNRESLLELLEYLLTIGAVMEVEKTKPTPLPMDAGLLSKGPVSGWKDTPNLPGIDRQLKRVRQCVDSQTGLITRVETVNRSESTPTHMISLFESIAFAGPNRGTGSANGTTAEKTELTAMVETLERYCLSVPPARRVSRIAAYEEIMETALYPPELVLYSEGQYAQPDFPMRRFCESEKMSWSRGLNLTTGETVLLPTEFISLRGPHGLVRATSSGAAGHRSIEEAVLNGLYELIERDAFTITWLNRLPVPRVTLPPTGGGLAGDMAEICRRFGYELRVYDLTSDIGVPILLSLAVDGTGRKHALCSGAGADLQPEAALRKGCYEVLRMFSRVRPAVTPPGLTDETVKRPFDHVYLYADPARLPRLDFLGKGTPPREFSRIKHHAFASPVETLKRCLDLLWEKGIDVYVVDITTPDVAELGIYVVKVFAPGLQPLHFGKKFRRLGGKRLFQAPLLWGYASTETDESHLNPHAHFFP